MYAVINAECRSNFHRNHMKKILLFIALVMSVGMICAQSSQVYKVEVGQFDKLKVTDNVNVVYRCLPDSSGWVQYRGAKEFADAFIITPKNGTLRIQVTTEDVGHPDLPTLYIYSDFLTSVENSSSFNVTIENPAPCAEFKAKEIGNGSINVENIKANIIKASLTTGNGSVNISGSRQKAEVQMIGTGIISIDRLEAQTVECKALGSGTIGCWPLERLVTKGIGSTKVYYKGDPVIKKSGRCKLYPLPEDRPLDTIVDDTEANDAEVSDAEGEEEDEETVVVEEDN